VFTLKLAADPTTNEQIKGTFAIGDAGVLTVYEEGLVPRLYSPNAWISIEDFRGTA
jgi:hypothetical protein